MCWCIPEAMALWCASEPENGVGLLPTQFQVSPFQSETAPAGNASSNQGVRLPSVFVPEAELVLPDPVELLVPDPEELVEPGTFLPELSQVARPPYRVYAI